VKRAYYEAKTLVAARPRIALPLARWRGRPAIVGDDTELVIESYPRCASSFAVTALRVAQDRQVEIAHHTHAPAQIIEAVRRGIPALVLVREPADAVPSLLVHSPYLTPASALRGFVRFYEPLLPHRSGFVVAHFDTVVSDFGRVVDSVNSRFGTTFARFEHTEANVARCLADIDRDFAEKVPDRDRLERMTARPSTTRAARKEQLRADYRAPSLARLRHRAEAAYDALCPG
jgi:hypothetical protein